MNNINKGSATLFHQQGKPYTSISNAVVDSIDNPDALAIWVFLQTKDNGWNVIGSYLQDKFSLGRKRYSDAMICLEKMGLVTYSIKRNELGHVQGRRVIVNYEPVLTEVCENPQFGETALRSDCTSVNRQLPIKDSLPIKEKIQNADKSADIEKAFEIFYRAGMRKLNKKAALKSFAKQVKERKVCPTEFANMLADDVRKRVAAQQMGFDAMHPTTYLNNERWEDEIVQRQEQQASPAKQFDNWYASDAGIDRKAKELGITPRATESYKDLKDRIQAHLKAGQLSTYQQDAQTTIYQELNDDDIPY